MTDEFTPLTVQDYVSQALTTDQRSDGGSLTFPLLGLFGETGSLLSEVKKKQRDRASYLGYASAVVEELGDVLWYLTAFAARGGLSLGDIAGNLDRGYADWQRAADGPLSFASLQPPIMTRRAEPTQAFEKTLLQLAGEVGLLMTDHEAGRLTNNQAALAGRLVAIMRTLIQAANEAGVTLEAAAVKNLGKIFDRWPRERIYPAPLDESAEAEEKLPRDLYVDVFERKVRGQTYVFQRCNGLNIGDRLTDNAMTADDYRFHDVFHYAYVAVLTWSPVIRALFRLKRKSDPKIDEAQDGARATLIEEGVATWIFGQAAALNLFADVKTGELPFDMLKHVRQFVAGYEAEQLPLWLWEEAILQGYAAFRFLREHRRGRLHIDTNNRRLTIEKLS
ncbi:MULTISPECIES: nucleoside triphosphate pyrophosphohydrolase family protein [Bradyrhizobium]|uniref:Pyrophosphatase n=1 Tax=Bradyrhizobium frederickii TaxID=2560054 RepID=A0A4Y9KQE3_9BRAD|nr:MULTISPECIES: nucleoside triphosphate pyrophosphohydrolase family protein [Bradyrhizobium]RTE88747.1 pyrophosphatase [Bradyrhizobium sp. LVM 105]TFV30238.1 pyrophosphatase [Bradyrhizobium frederickii]TFV68370.1 pyrophosphatase [Bradyrhizobium frederickii]